MCKTECHSTSHLRYENAFIRWQGCSLVSPTFQWSLLYSYSLPYREIITDSGIVEWQTWASLLPTGSCMAMTEYNFGVDSNDFHTWALNFLHSVQDLTANNHKVLLTYDTYSAHRSKRVLELFASSGIMTYGLPAHSLGRTQTCDVPAFGEFKHELNIVISSTFSCTSSEHYDVFEFCQCLSKAFYKAFTRQNIISSFCRSGLWPLQPYRLLLFHFRMPQVTSE